MVDYSSLENYRTERYRGFESLSLRHLMKREPYGFPFFVPENQLLAFELRITFEHKQKYMKTGIRFLPKHWHRGTVVNRIDARELNETLEKLMAEVRQVILDMMGESVMDIFSIQERSKRKRASAISFLEFCEQRTKIRHTPTYTTSMRAKLRK